MALNENPMSPNKAQSLTKTLLINDQSYEFKLNLDP